MSVNEVVAYTEILSCTPKSLVTDFGRYLDRDKFNWFSKIQELQILCITGEGTATAKTWH